MVVSAAEKKKLLCRGFFFESLAEMVGLVLSPESRMSTGVQPLQVKRLPLLIPFDVLADARQRRTPPDSPMAGFVAPSF
jgi:hypothetical protein